MGMGLNICIGFVLYYCPNLLLSGSLRISQNIFTLQLDLEDLTTTVEKLQFSVETNINFVSDDWLDLKVRRQLLRVNSNMEVQETSSEEGDSDTHWNTLSDESTDNE